MVNLFTNEKETKRAIKAAVDQAEKVKKDFRTHCARCGCIPKPDEWGDQGLHYCIDCV